MVKFKRHGKYVSERLKPPAYFDKRSFRTVKRGEHIVTVGCRFGKWDTRRKVCSIGVEAQRILHPASEFKGKHFDPLLMADEWSKLNPVDRGYLLQTVLKSDGKVESKWDDLSRSVKTKLAGMRAFWPSGSPCPVRGSTLYDVLPKPRDTFFPAQVQLRRVPEIDDLTEIAVHVPPHVFDQLKREGGWHEEHGGFRLVRRGRKNKATNIFVLKKGA